MKLGAILLAAGRGARFGADKTTASLGGRPVWTWSADALSAILEPAYIVAVGNADNQAALAERFPTVPGGQTRQASVQRGLEALPADADWALIQDAARPFLSGDLVDRLVRASEGRDGVAPAVPVVDTIRQLGSEYAVVDRNRLVGMQTPQLVRVSAMRDAQSRADAEYTDDLALLQSAGYAIGLMEGDPDNFKITTPADLARARAMVGGRETRTGLGFDIHRFSDDPNRPLWLGGVHFPGEIGLEGHSDADAVLHAAVDAILGALARGDIGQHFPNTDPQWKDRASIEFLRHARSLTPGWDMVHLDIAVIAERPRIMRRAEEIRTVIAKALGVGMDRVSIKATTNEGLGSLGRGEGIAAYATATLRESA